MLILGRWHPRSGYWHPGGSRATSLWAEDWSRSRETTQTCLPIIHSYSVDIFQVWRYSFSFGFVRDFYILRISIHTDYPNVRRHQMVEDQHRRWRPPLRAGPWTLQGEGEALWWGLVSSPLHTCTRKLLPELQSEFGTLQHLKIGIFYIKIWIST